MNDDTMLQVRLSNFGDQSVAMVVGTSAAASGTQVLFFFGLKRSLSN